MADVFMIGASTNPSPLTWSTVETLLAGEDVTMRALDWSYEPYSQYAALASGQDRGRGLPVVVWKFRALRIEQRENLRDFVPGVSNSVYIRTPTNETAAGVRVWKDFLCIAHWMQRSELSSDGLDLTEEVEISFTHCEVIT